ncbi:FAD-linked oxidase [Candidatus Acidianus copahuensis]|uniref:FAD-linked oxidase n=1 Tax=Candidatus Acidianus copahuensis TaxID=1160895 RepID=A0A031LKI4_9CREN|nr:FAD-binding and (Fe-S)-binding domain-containing protein [Candidatus Acidianus copahuensis]EZQ02066.1 FAD-linked oxidase [Candidatus Acidianus copahuensis]
MGLREDFGKRFEENFSDSLVERLSHSADMGFVPQLVWTGIKINIIPDYVIYPQNVEDVVDAVKLALQYGVPIVPYGRGTNRYGNAIPADGGLLLDFSKMEKVQIDEQNKLAIVEPGATWKIIDLNAQARNLQLRTFPSSYDSTAGGGIAGDVLGIGSYEFGFLCDNISFVDLVNPKAEIVHLEGKDLALVCGSEGTTGIIVKAGIKLKQFSRTESMVISFDSFAKAYNAIGEFYREVVPAWHVQVRGPAISSYLADKFKARLDPNKWNMVILYPSTRASVVEPKLYKISQTFGGNIFEGEWTGWWSFNHGVNAALRTKGLLIHQHGLIHYTKINELIDGLQKNLGNIGLLDPEKGFDLDIDLERREVLLVNAFTQTTLPSVDKKIIYDLAKNTLMMEEYVKVGGSMLSIGMFVHKYAKNRLSAMGKTFQELGVDRYEVMKKYKEEMDPDELFNPGKVFEPKKRAKTLLEIVNKQNEALKFRFGIGFAKVLSPGGEVDGYKVSKRYLDIFADYALTCIDCAMCVTVCPQFRLIPQWPYAPKGMFDFAKGVISYYQIHEEVDVPDSAIAEISGCDKCALCDGVCPAKIPISTLLIKLNSLVARKIPEEPTADITIPDEYKDIVDDGSEIGIWLGKFVNENPQVLLAVLELMKKLGIKIKLFNTSLDSGFMDYISGNGNVLTEKIKLNSEKLQNVAELLTVSPEDYRTFSEAYREYSRLVGTRMDVEPTPIDLKLLKAIQFEGSEEINLHAACFSSPYIDEVIKRLREKGFKVKKIEGCSGAVLEKNLGKRSDMMARALAERYQEIVTLCPLAAAKFKAVGVNAKTLIEFIGERVGVKIDYAQKTVQVGEEDKLQIQKLFYDSILSSLQKRFQIIADTASFISSGKDEYEKIIEPIIKEAIEESANNFVEMIRGIISTKTKDMNQTEKMLLTSAYVREASSILLSASFENLIAQVVSGVKSFTSEEFDQKTLADSVLDLLRFNTSIFKKAISSI